MSNAKITTLCFLVASLVSLLPPATAEANSSDFCRGLKKELVDRVFYAQVHIYDTVVTPEEIDLEHDKDEIERGKKARIVHVECNQEKIVFAVRPDDFYGEKVTIEFMLHQKDRIKPRNKAVFERMMASVLDSSPPPIETASSDYDSAGTPAPDDDRLIGIWVGNQCGRTFELAITANDDGNDEALKASLVNGDDVGYGYSDGDPFFYVSPLAESGRYHGKIVYRNVIMKRWFPTQVDLNSADSFTTYDDATIQTCGGRQHHYVRKVARNFDVQESRPAPRGGTGSGFLLADSNIVMTNHHVIDSGEFFSVRFPFGEEFEAEVIGKDEQADLALLKLKSFEATSGTGISIDPRRRARVGSTVHAIGYPFGPGLSKNPSMVSGQVSSETGLDDDANQFRMTTAINHGNSGGPIFDSHGLLIGIAVGGLRGESIEGITFGIKTSSALSVLLDAGIDTGMPKPSTDLEPEDIYESLKDSVVLIEVH